VPVPARRRRGNGERLTVRGARANNLKDVDGLASRSAR
jgi:excinuclease ABC subunit A